MRLATATTAQVPDPACVTLKEGDDIIVTAELNLCVVLVIALDQTTPAAAPTHGTTRDPRGQTTITEDRPAARRRY
jgi:hypothetical protein